MKATPNAAPGLPLVIPIVNLDVRQPIDFVTPVDNVGGQISIFITMLNRIESLSLTTCMAQVAEGMNALDYLKIKLGAHSLKGASGYVGAGRVHYCCYHIQKAFVEEKFDLMVSYYPFLVEFVIEFKRFSRKYLAEQKRKYFFHLHHQKQVVRPTLPNV